MADFFEGREKLLEVWFCPTSPEESNHPTGMKGLRKIPRAQIEELLTLAQCTILGDLHNDHMDSYVLSESSLFVTPYRFLLKTCGSTTLLLSVPKLLELAASVGLRKVDEMFYSRHAFMKPHEQQAPHQSFEQELAFLNQNELPGNSFCFGPPSDCWYLYLLSRPLKLPEADQTLELMMHDLDRDAMSIFYKKDLTAQEVTERSGIGSIAPKYEIHEYLFEPCGYSCNAIFEGSYFTIHITPQPEFSYVSFETDMAVEDYTPLVQKVLRIFRPGRFSMSLFTTDHAEAPMGLHSLPGFSCSSQTSRKIQRYHLHFARFSETYEPRGLSSAGSETGSDDSE